MQCLTLMILEHRVAPTEPHPNTHHTKLSTPCSWEIVLTAVRKGIVGEVSSQLPCMQAASLFLKLLFLQTFWLYSESLNSSAALEADQKSCFLFL